MTDDKLTNMAIKLCRTSLLIGGLSLLLFLIGCTQPPKCPPCLEKECPTCEVCEVCMLPEPEIAYDMYQCMPYSEVNQIINTTNTLVEYVNKFDLEDGESELTPISYLTIKEVGE